MISSTVSANELVEFSTSMDIDEFSVVLKYLESKDRVLSNELNVIISNFKKSTSIGSSSHIKLKENTGYVKLEKEDDYTLTVSIFLLMEVNAKLELAYQ